MDVEAAILLINKTTFAVITIVIYLLSVVAQRHNPIIEKFRELDRIACVKEENIRWLFWAHERANCFT